MVLLPILMSIEQPLIVSKEKLYKLVMLLISKELVDPVKQLLCRAQAHKNNAP